MTNSNQSTGYKVLGEKLKQLGWDLWGTRRGRFSVPRAAGGGSVEGWVRSARLVLSLIRS